MSTLIGSGTHIESGIRGSDDIHIEGRVDGAVIGEAAVKIVAGAQVGGAVQGREVIIGGVLRHGVQATQSVHLLATAEVYGDITAPRIIVDDGAVLEGQVKITRSQAAKESAERRKEKSPMRQIAAPPAPTPPAERQGPRTIPELPPLGRRVATRRRA